MYNKLSTQTINIYSINSSELIFDPYVQLKCQHCINYASSYSCPPYTPKYYQSKEIISKYSNVLLIVKYYQMESFKEGMMKKGLSGTNLLRFALLYFDRISYWDFHEVILRLRESFKESEKILAFGPGGKCRLCKTCNINFGLPCKKPDKSIPSPESWGIDIYGTLKSFGIPIEIPPRNIFCRVGLITGDLSKITNRGDVETGLKFKNYYENINYSKLPELLDSIPGCKFLEIRNAIEFFSEDVNRICEKCRFKSWLCNREFLHPNMNEIKKWLVNKKLVILRLMPGKEAKVLKECINNLHRNGYWWALPFSNRPCSICKSCSNVKCSYQKRMWKKEFWRCVYYILLSPPKFMNSFYILV